MQLFHAFMQFAGAKGGDMYAVAPWLRPPETEADRERQKRDRSAFQRGLALAAVRTSPAPGGAGIVDAGGEG